MELIHHSLVAIMVAEILLAILMETLGNRLVVD